MSKPLLGFIGALVVALALTFTLLMRAQESIGLLQGEVEQAVQANERAALAIDAERENTARIQQALRVQQQATAEAEQARRTSDQQRDAAIAAAEKRIRDATANLPAESCARQLVPQPLIDSLHHD